MEPVPTPFLGNRVYPETDMLSVLEKKTVPFCHGGRIPSAVAAEPLLFQEAAFLFILNPIIAIQKSTTHGHRPGEEQYETNTSEKVYLYGNLLRLGPVL